MKSAEQILQMVTPEELFTKDNIKEEYRKLAMQWHPDRCTDPRCTDVFIHLDKLYKSGIFKVSNGCWYFKGMLKLESNLGTKFKILYRKQIPFELGDMYISDSTITYMIDKSYKKLYDNYIWNVQGFKFPNEDLRKSTSVLLPSIKTMFEVEDKLVLCIRKTPDVVPLSIVLEYYNGIIPPRHAAWIMSTLHNMLCFLNYNGIAHNDISTTTYFISPQYHTGLLLGGWWYAVKDHTRLHSVPARTYEFMSVKDRTSKLANAKVDGELARNVCRKILGDENGSKLVSALGVPKDFANWIMLPGSDPVKDYELWQDVLTKSFGPRKFVAMDINLEEAYKKE